MSFTPLMPVARHGLQRTILVLAAVALAACGGGGGGGGTPPPTNNPPPTNTAPVAQAGDDQSVEQNTVVALQGSGIDQQTAAAALSYSWTQLSGPSVTLSNANEAAPTFDAPATNDFVVLEFQLTVSDGALSDTDTVAVTVFNDASAPLVVGSVSYEDVTWDSAGLDYNQITELPVRGATVQVIAQGASTVLAEAVLDDDGRFSLLAPANTDVFVRVRAELKQTGLPSWDVEVRDNTSSTTLPLDQRPLYVLDGTPFNTGMSPTGVTLVARTGWTGTGYTQVRASGPFAILDTIYSAIELIVAVDADAVFAPLDAFWSVNNSVAGTTGGSIDTGEIGTSFYRRDTDSLFLVGTANEDTDEFDSPVVAHEWGHYFEDNFARSDSIGGSWSLNFFLDPRLAFGEGWGDAVACMVLNDPLYFDTSGTRQDAGFSFSVDENRTTAPNRGYYSARSVQAIIWDLFDSDDDVTDTVSIGFQAIYDVLVNEQANGVPFTSIYPFLEGIRAREPGSAAAIDVLVAGQRIQFNADAYGTGESNDASAGADVLPVYSEVIVNGPAVNICSTNRFDPDEVGNRLGIRRFVRFNAPTAGSYTFDAVTTNPPAVGQADPDIFVFQVDFVGGGQSGDANRETFSLNLAAGEHVAEIFEWSYLRDGGAAIDQPNDNTCFDLTISL